MPRPTLPSVDSLRPSGSRLPQFLSPSEEPTTTSPSDLPDLPTTEGEPEWGSNLPQDDVLDEAPAPAPRTSSGGSSADKAIGELKISELAYGLVDGAGELLHDGLARDDYARDAGLFLTDQQDRVMIGDPLANVLERRVPKDVLGDTDASDLVAAMVGVAVYGGKQFMKWLGVRRARRTARRAAAQAAAAVGATEAATDPYTSL